MTKIFIDCEFNGFGGELMSMGLVDENGREFYEVVEITQPYDPWVAANVVPHLNASPIPYLAFQGRLHEWLSVYLTGFTLIADWPDDLRYFLSAVITAPGMMMQLPSFKLEMIREIGARGSKVPHNALSDALAIKKSYEKVAV